MVDWLAIKTEYITGTISQRKLAEKYGISQAAISRRAKAEGWKVERESFDESIRIKTNQKSIEKISDTTSDTAAIKARLDQKLWSLIDQAAGELTTEGPIDPADLRRVVQCYVDMRSVPEDIQSNMEQHQALMAALKEATRREN